MTAEEPRLRGGNGEGEVSENAKPVSAKKSARGWFPKRWLKAANANNSCPGRLLRSLRWPLLLRVLRVLLLIELT